MLDQVVEILLVEDNQDDEEMTLLALGENWFASRIDVARDGEEALEYLFCAGRYAHRRLRQPPRLILLDIKLPRLDGLQVLERIKADPRTCAIPVVILTSSREEADVARGYELGVNSYIVKPVDFEQFSDSIRHIGYYWMLLNETPEP